MVSNAALDQHLKNLAGEEAFQQVLEFQQKCVHSSYGEREWFFRDGFLLEGGKIRLAFRALESEEQPRGLGTYFLGVGNLDRGNFVLEDSFEARQGMNRIRPARRLFGNLVSQVSIKNYVKISETTEDEITKIIRKIPCYVLPRKKEVVEAYFGPFVKLFHAEKPSSRLTSDNSFLRKEGVFRCQEMAYANSMDGVILNPIINTFTGNINFDGHYSFIKKED